MHEVQLSGTPISRHVAPTALQDVLDLLAEHGASARLIAGGTDLIMELDRRVRPGVSMLIDITRLDGLSHIEHLEDGRIRIGALVTHNQVVASDLLWEHATPLAQASWEVGSPQLRNRATVVGNLVTASPANDTISPLRVLDAELTLASDGGERVVTLAEFHTGVRTSVLRPDEIVTHVTFRSLYPDERAVFVKAGNRSAQAISVVHGTISVRRSGETVTDARIALGSVAPTIVAVDSAESLLVAQPLSDDNILAAAEAAAAACKPIDDVRSSAGHRTAMIAAIVTRALETLRDAAPIRPEHPALLSPTGTSHRPGSEVDARATTDIETSVNGVPMRGTRAPGETLLDWIRDELGLTGTKEGCAEGECGACTIIVDGSAVMSCLVPASMAEGRHVTTIEGLEVDGELHPLQQAFIENAAVQCGFCIPGFLVAGASLLDEIPSPTPNQLIDAMAGNLCRCTGYYKIVDAFNQAANA
ncbi:MAG: 2Fe-2S iron-sulfur cluster binding domain-containing protein [Acidimicrobiia bacterium]|nr:2Fe-2S iron-sulfur cluster binding domain-containing protein [Acidimicrobiia bacterium]